MAKAHLVVRAEVPDIADRAAFDRCYATYHLPWAIRAFGARRAGGAGAAATQPSITLFTNWRMSGRQKR